ncbi:mitochondrial 2-oxoglutarate/malate carrier protein-like [Epargyreus clarus]|uniref:mitochondrial 2-oxoglutarate/malate carrier protein-like n=1 Tax=Epargyreus clarus TaxID=520877 RepID=UPI003C2F8A5F
MKVPADEKTQKHNISWAAKVAIGGVAGMVATSAVHPLDVVKVRMQIFPSSCTTLSIASRLVRCQGFRALYAGLTAGLMRQATNTTTRLGVYNWLYDSYHRIWKEEGVGALWRGGTLTLSRSVFVSSIHLGSYAQAQEMIRDRRVAKGFALHVYTSLIISFFTAILTLPIDLVKTRYQVRRSGVTQKEIFSEILQQKGVRYFWKGFVPYYIRMAIHTITAFLVVEELNELYFKHKYSSTK